LAQVIGEIRMPDGKVVRSYQGDPPGRSAGTLVLVHGLGEHAGRYVPVAEYLMRQGWTVRACDHRGHGGTGGRLPSFQTLLADLAFQVTYWSERAPRPLYVLGQSLGGSLVLNLVLSGSPPLSGVIALSPLLLPSVPPPTWKWLAAQVLGRLAPGVIFRSGISADDLSHDPDVVWAYRQDPWVHDRVSAILGRTMLEAGRWTLRHSRLLKIPLLLMHGSADRITSAVASRGFAERAGGQCTLKIWEGLYHELHFETRSGEVLQTVSDWLTIVSQRTMSPSTSG
jgi:alpha-beta hydrolase superfamily lysophospholipase